MEFRRRVAKALLVVVALLAPVAVGIAAGTAPAEAATCHGAGCAGKDPHTTGCDSSAETVNFGTKKNPKEVFYIHYQYPGGSGPEYWSYELRFSSRCDTYWTKGTSDEPSYPELMIQKQCLSVTTGYHNCGVQPKQKTGGTFWTSMVGGLTNSTERVRACMNPEASNPKDLNNHWYCTPWHHL